MLRAWILVVGCTLCACVESDLVECKNGVSCPQGTVCDEQHLTCVTPEQATVCASHVDNSPCLDGGACHHGICVPIRCGNWLRDPLEMCDDGNTIDGDGCSASCTSTERCGNGFVDDADGEQCDDGALASHDGCDSQCQPEQLQFTKLDQRGEVPRARAAYAFDSERGKLVLFGGVDGTGVILSDTAELDAATQTMIVRTPRVSPTGRERASAAFDAARHVVVMYGGRNAANEPLGQTWTWDGEQWALHAPAVSPPPRYDAGLVYDSRRKRALLFGGRGAAGLLADLWAWDGIAWTELAPPVQPPPREQMSIAYDPIRDEVVLFGGLAGTSLGDQWIFDGTAWEQVTPAGLPPPQPDRTLVYDATLRGLVIAAPTALLWNGVQWSAIGATPFANRSGTVAFYDPTVGTTIAGLGMTSTVQGTYFRLDDAGWSAFVIEGGLPNALGNIAFDAGRGRTYSIGGGPMWQHDGTAWARAGQEPNGGQVLAYDEAREKPVACCGPQMAMHVWDGTMWTTITPTTAPQQRDQMKLAYDAISKRVLMFGGGNMPNDTWLWDGANWTQATTTSVPQGRRAQGLAFDRARGQIVMFGGYGVGDIRLGDTWTWTAASGWVEHQTSPSPSPRGKVALVEDPIRGDLLLFGTTEGGTPPGELWRWNGATWSRILAEDTPTFANAVAAAYDTARRQFVFVAPEGQYRLQWRGPTRDEACTSILDRDDDGLAACADLDCAGYCTPLCPLGGGLGNSCPIGPECGDSVCSPLENCRVCPRDCGACEPRCGDGVCDGIEQCSGECPT